jgi:formylmethanofuran dehydrogenase subunit B
MTIIFCGVCGAKCDDVKIDTSKEPFLVSGSCSNCGNDGGESSTKEVSK